MFYFRVMDIVFFSKKGKTLCFFMFLGVALYLGQLFVNLQCTTLYSIQYLALLSATVCCCFCCCPLLGSWFNAAVAALLLLLLCCSAALLLLLFCCCCCR